MQHLILFCVLLLVEISIVQGHGRLMDPPSRNSMWRAGFPNPPNYNDNELNCGGFSYQWSVHGGKCGVCGDPYGKTQKHVSPGKYANNIITRTYRIGQEVEVKVQITANHKGYFTFKIGDIGKGSITEEKLNHILKIAGSGKTRYYLPKGSGAGLFMVSLKLPQALTCKHCVLQWTYRAGNSWGTDETGSGIGKGGQETFVNCADVRIEGAEGPQPTGKVTSPALTAPRTEPRSVSSSHVTQTPPKKATTTKVTSLPKETTAKQQTLMTVMGTKTTAMIKTDGPTNPEKLKCRGIASHAGVPGMDDWCNANCPLFCPKSHCACSTEPTKAVRCRGAGAYASVAGMDLWCSTNCPAFCPKSHCICA